MIPIVTPEEMGAIDAAAPEPVEVLIGRAGAAVARAALDLLGGAYGRRVVVLAGKGNNGNDGRAAAGACGAAGCAARWSTPPTRPPSLPPVRPRDRRRLRHGFRGTFDAARACREPGDRRCSPSTSRPASTGSPARRAGARSRPTAR